MLFPCHSIHRASVTIPSLRRSSPMLVDSIPHLPGAYPPLIYPKPLHRISYQFRFISIRCRCITDHIRSTSHRFGTMPFHIPSILFPRFTNHFPRLSYQFISLSYLFLSPAYPCIANPSPCVTAPSLSIAVPFSATPSQVNASFS